MLIPIFSLCLAAKSLPSGSQQWAWERAGVFTCLSRTLNLCLGYHWAVPIPPWWLGQEGADSTAAGLAVSMVITLQIYCTVSVFFHFIKHICDGSWRFLGTRNKATNCPILPSPFRFIIRICIEKGWHGMVSAFIAWPLTWPHILPGYSKSVPMSWQK